MIAASGIFVAIISHANNLELTKKPVMVWFVVHSIEHSMDGDKATNEVVSDLSENPNLMHLAKVLHEKASAKGLSLVLPYGDLEDMSAISPDNLWQMKVNDLDKLQKASERYHSPDILVIKMNMESKETCFSRWLLILEAQKQITPWEENADNCDAAIQAGMTRTMEVLKQVTPNVNAVEVNVSAANANVSNMNKKAVSETSDTIISSSVATPKSAVPEAKAQETLLIHVSISNIQSAQDYQRVLDDLQKQPNVVDVQIENVAPSKVLYATHIHGSLDDFVNDMEKVSKTSNPANPIQLQLLHQDSLEYKVEYLLIKENMQ